MNVLVAKGEDLSLSKSRAFKYKQIDFTGVSCGQGFVMQEKENSLVAIPVDNTGVSDSDITYSIICDEFGLYGMSNHVHAKVKVSFCDNNKMIVDLIDGALLIKPEDDIMVVSRGVEMLPEVDPNEILWVDANKILEYAQYWGNLQSHHIQDFEFVLNLKGEMRGILESFGIKHIKEETVDISGGHIAMLEMEMRKKQEEHEEREMLHNQAMNVQNGFADLVSQYNNSSYDDEYYDDEDLYEEDDDDLFEEDDDDYEEDDEYEGNSDSKQ